MKWLKRIIRFAIGAVVLTLIALGVVIHLYRSTPDWYHNRPLTVQERKQADTEVMQTFGDLVTWAASVQAQKTRQQLGNATKESPIGDKTITLSEAGLNALAENYPRSDQSLERTVSPILKEARIILVENEIILAGSSDLGTLSSVQFEPGFDDKGQFWLRLAGVSAGRLPVPRAMLSDRISQARAGLQNGIDKYRDEARIDSTGMANGSAAIAVMSRLLLNCLDDKPSEPVLFIPYYLGDWNRLLTVRLDSIRIVEGSVSMRLSPMPAEETAALLEKIHRDSQPVDAAQQ